MADSPSDGDGSGMHARPTSAPAEITARARQATRDAARVACIIDTECRVGFSAGLLGFADRPVGRPAGRQAGRLAGWLAGRQAGRQEAGWQTGS